MTALSESGFVHRHPRQKTYSLGIAPGYAWETNTLRFEYSSPAQPAQVFDYDMESRARALRSASIRSLP